MSAGIYQIKNLVNNKVYVGSAVDVKQRIRAHRHLLKQGNHFNKHLQSAWDKYGENSFKFNLLQTVENKEELLSIEQEYLDSLDSDTKYNQREVAESNFGMKFSYEWRNNLSLAHQGKKASEETKEKMSLAHSGIKHPMYGKHHTEESKKKISENRKGIVAICGEQCWQVKLNPWKVRVIRQILKRSKMKQIEISKVFGVDPSAISDINTKKTWKQVL